MTPRIKAAAIHFSISLFIAFLVAGLVFVLWYPAPHHHLSGGMNLFFLLAGVDLVLGPLLTLVIFNISKPRRELVRDVLIIAAVQLAALLYGLNTVFQARPVYIVFEYKRFQVIYASDLSQELLDKAPSEFRHLPLSGPAYLSIRPMRAEEKLNFILQELSGFPLANRTDMWRPYAEASTTVLTAAKPIHGAKPNLTTEQRKQLQKLLQKKGLSEQDVLYLPLLSRASNIATIFVNAHTAEVLGISEEYID